MKFIYLLCLSYEYVSVRLLARTRVWRFKSLCKKTGENIGIVGPYDLLNAQNLIVGNNLTINNGVYINAMSPITLGDNVVLSAGCKIVAAGLDLDRWKDGDKAHLKDQDIVIGNNIWVGAGAIILGGVNIVGEHVVVAAGAIVTRDINESNVVVAGCPARIVKRMVT